MAKKIMFQGTSSNVGKSILVYRIMPYLYRKGFKPFLLKLKIWPSILM